MFGSTIDMTNWKGKDKLIWFSIVMSKLLKYWIQVDYVSPIIMGYNWNPVLRGFVICGDT